MPARLLRLVLALAFAMTGLAAVGAGTSAAAGTASTRGTVTAAGAAAGAGERRAAPAFSRCSLPVGNDPRLVTAADVDGVGDPELVTIGLDASALTRGAGGTYTESTLATGYNGQSDVASADLDGDGDQDLVATGSDAGGAFAPPGSLTVLTNDGTGQLTPSSVDLSGIVDVEDRPRSVAITDLDGAGGDPDIVVSAGENSIYAFARQPDDSYALVSPDSLGFAHRLPRGIVAANLDADAAPELVTANFGHETVSVLDRQSDGSYETTSLTAGDQPYSVVAADLDGDGDRDLAAANYIGRSITLFANAGTGTFAAGRTVPGVLGSVYDRYGELAVSDVDGDTDPDLVLERFEVSEDGFFGDAFADVLLHDGSSLATNEFAATQVGRIGVGASSFVVGDLDGDGDGDVAATQAEDDEAFGRVTILSNQRNAADPPCVPAPDTTPPTAADDVPGTPVDGPFAVTLTAADEPDGSGVKEIRYLVGSNPADPSVGANSPLVYDPGAKPVLQDGQRIRYVAVDNADNVGTPKHLQGARGANCAASEFNLTPAGSLGNAGTDPQSVVSGDFDDDGDLDLAAGNNNSDDVTIYSNDGAGTFTTSTAPAPGSNVDALAVGDADADGDLDLVVAHSDRTVSLLTNDGAGSFTAVAITLGDSSVVGSTLGVALGDADGDGDTDIVAVDSTYDGVWVLTRCRAGGATPKRRHGPVRPLRRHRRRHRR